MQWALEQSMRDHALNTPGELPVYDEDDYDEDLMRALRDSLNLAANTPTGQVEAERRLPTYEEVLSCALLGKSLQDELERVLRISREEAELQDAERQRQERELDEAIQLSLIDK